MVFQECQPETLDYFSPGCELTSPSKSQRLLKTKLAPSAGRRRTTPSPSPERTVQSLSQDKQDASDIYRGIFPEADQDSIQSDALSAFSPTSWSQAGARGRQVKFVDQVEAARGLERQADELASLQRAKSLQEQHDAAATSKQKSLELFASFDKKASDAWSIEFEADALAAQSECRFLQAEVHRLLAERAAEQITTGRNIAEMEATVANLQAEREAERSLMREVRAGLEVATARLSEGYESKLRQMEDENSSLKRQVNHLEAELSETQARLLQDRLAERRWRSAVAGRMLTARMALS